MGEVELYGETRKAMKRLLPQRYVSFKLNDMRTSGIPDMIVVANHIFSGWEFKFNDHDGFHWEGIQWLTACRLDREAYCRYVIYDEDTSLIYIVKPLELPEFVKTVNTSAPLHYEWGIPEKRDTRGVCRGFDHAALVQHIREVHKL